MRRVAVWLALAAGCARPAPAPPAAPAAPSPPGLTVTLRWTAPVDLDLYVTDPALETVYFANPRTATGGILERDSRCAGHATGEQIERARWTDPPPGRYRVGVDFLEACGGRVGTATWTLTVEVAGQRRDVTGRARLAERDPAVFEFTVPGEDRR